MLGNFLHYGYTATLIATIHLPVPQPTEVARLFRTFPFDALVETCTPEFRAEAIKPANILAAIAHVSAQARPGSP
jgi:hypothetical protein